MATTVGGFSAIDDTEVDAESPITETLITRLRDNSYWIDAGTRRTGETSTTKVLTPDGSGGVAWVEVAGLAGVNGSSDRSTANGVAPETSITIPANVKCVTGHFRALDDAAAQRLSGSYSFEVSTSKLTIVSMGTENVATARIISLAGPDQITLTSSYTTIATLTANFQFKIDGSNLHFKNTSTDSDSSVILSGTYF